MRTIVITSDMYLKCLPSFTFYHNRHLGDRSGVIFCYQMPQQTLPHNFSVVSLGSQRAHTWSSGLQMAFSRLPRDEIVLFMLEDYFITRADRNMIDALHRYMMVYPHVGKIDLSGDRLKVAYSQHDRIDDVDLVRTENVAYQFSVQAALWRAGFLADYLRDDETAWQMEKGATARYNSTVEKGIEDRLVLGTKPAVLEYVNAVGGEGKKPGEWDHKKIPTHMWNEMMKERLV
jgi:hypothetical protein